MKFNTVVSAVIAFAALCSACPMSARAADLMSATTQDHALIQTLAARALQCVHQPYVLKRSGNKAYRQTRSHCEDVIVSSDRAEFRLPSGTYTLIIKDNPVSDDGDLNDVYLQSPSRDGGEAQEVLLQSAVLAFNDPIIALLVIAGENPEKLPEIALLADSPSQDE